MKTLEWNQMEMLQGGRSSRRGGSAAKCLKLGVATGLGLVLGAFAGPLGVAGAALGGYVTAVENDCL